MSIFGLIGSIATVLAILVPFMVRKQIKKEREGIYNEFKELEGLLAAALAENDTGRADSIRYRMRELRKRHRFLDEQ